MQNLVKLPIISLYGVQICIDIDHFYKSKSQNWIETEYDGKVTENRQKANGNYIVKLTENKELEGDNDVQNTLPSHIGALIFHGCERNMNNVTRERNGFYNNSVHYGDTDLLYTE